MCRSTRKRPHSAVGTFKLPQTCAAVAEETKSLQNPLVVEFEDELVYRRATLGPYHQEIAETLKALGLVLNHMVCDPESALQCHRKALKILQMHTCFQSVQFDMAVTMADIGDVQLKMNCYEQAAASYSEAITAFDTSVRGRNHPRAVSTLNKLSQIGRGSDLSTCAEPK